MEALDDLGRTLSSAWISLFAMILGRKPSSTTVSKRFLTVTQLLRFSVMWENRRREFLSEQRF